PINSPPRGSIARPVQQQMDGRGEIRRALRVDEESTAVAGGEVSRSALQVGTAAAGDEKGPRWAGSERGAPRIDRDRPQGQIGPEKIELFAIAPPLRLISPGPRSLPLCRRRRQRLHVDLVASRLVG